MINDFINIFGEIENTYSGILVWVVCAWVACWTICKLLDCIIGLISGGKSA